MYKIKCDSCNAVSINGTATHEPGCYHGVMIYTRVDNGKQYVKAKVWSLDVWGNRRDGFEVNDRSERGYVMIPLKGYGLDKPIIKALKQAGMLNKKCHYDSFSVDGDKLLMVDAAKTGEPIYQLEIL